MLNDIYNHRVLELAADIPRLGRWPRRTRRQGAFAALRLDGHRGPQRKDGKVGDFAHDVRACALGQASSSLMARHILGATPEELKALRETMTAMLKAGGPPPEGKWADFAVLEPVRDYKARHASTLLTFDAVVDALGQIAREGRGSGRSPPA